MTAQDLAARTDGAAAPRFEYRSRLSIAGLPLVHIVRGIDPSSGRRPPAVGVIAVGQVAIGLIAIGQVAHETNTFCQGLTEVADFQRREWLHGDEIVATHKGNRTDLGGMLDAAERLGIEVIPTFSATTEPSGTIARAALRIARAIRAAAGG